MSELQHYLNASLSGSRRFDGKDEFYDFLLDLYRVDPAQKYTNINTDSNLLYVRLDDKLFYDVFVFGNFDSRVIFKDITYPMVWGRGRPGADQIRHDIIHFNILDENGDDVLPDNYINKVGDIGHLLKEVFSNSPNYDKCILFVYHLDVSTGDGGYSNIIHRIHLDDERLPIRLDDDGNHPNIIHQILLEDVDDNNDESINWDINKFEQYLHSPIDLSKLDELNDMNDVDEFHERNV